MILFVTPSTILNRGILSLRQAPKKFLGRGAQPTPRGTVLKAVFWRLFFENALPRYIVALSPFALILVVFPESALGMSQAPLLMLAVVLFVETYVLSIADPAKRRALIDEVEGEKAIDRFQLRAKAALTEIAAGRGVSAGAMHLVVEQSEMWRAPPLTLISVQRPALESVNEDGESGFLDLTGEERRLIVSRLFDEALTERLLHRVNMASSTPLRSVALEARSVSAHARLAAMARK
ncbi:MAG: hypothetical protein AAGM38_14770 [Pseudomonadota bacterium]